MDGGWANAESSKRGFIVFLGVVDDGGIATELDIAEDGADGVKRGGAGATFLIQALKEQRTEREFAAQGGDGGVITPGKVNGQHGGSFQGGPVYHAGARWHEVAEGFPLN